MNVLAFNIETIPDIEGGQRIHQLLGLDDNSTSKALFHLRQQKTGSRKLPLYLQRIAAISVVYRGMDDGMDHEVSVRSLGDVNSSEAQLLKLFFDETGRGSERSEGKGIVSPLLRFCKNSAEIKIGLFEIFPSCLSNIIPGNAHT